MSKAKENFDKYIGNYGGHEICKTQVKELKEQNKELIKLIEYCLYDEDFDAQNVQIRLRTIVNE